MSEWLFKYPASSWREASLGFESPWPLAALGIAILLALVLIVASLWNRPLGKRRRSMIFVLQFIVAVVVLTMLWQPALKLEVAEQGENTVAWVVDTSQSMRTVDVLKSREFTTELQSRLDAGGSIIDSIALEDEAEFDAALYSQGTSLDSIKSVEQLAAVEPSFSTHFAQGLDELLGTVAQNALAAVVLISDGSDNSDEIDAQWWQRLSAAGVPVHTVGVGRVRHPSDIQLSDVTLPEQAAPNVQLSARLDIRHSIGGSARIRVFSGRDLVAAEDIQLPSDVRQSVHEVKLPTGESGIRQLRFEVIGNDEWVDPDLANNAQPRVLRVVESPKRILYVEGEPRWEYKFLRRALNNHPMVEIVSLLRTSPNKFYRQGVRDAEELADGFPSSREVLFSYDAVIVGSLEAAELSTDQQLALRDFVSVRGGTLMMLGGRHGLADGGWGRSVVAAALPVILDARLAAETFTRERRQVLPTVSGFRTDWLSLGDTNSLNVEAWQGLPELADWQALGNVKPGAVVLLEHVQLDANVSDIEPLLVSQRYGKGTSLVLGTSGTWRWQMGLESTDQRHEMFWRQLATKLVDGVVPRISVAASKAVYRDSDTAMISVDAYSAGYEPLRQASLPVQMTLPDGSVQTVALQADALRPGSYVGSVDTVLDGPYTINAMTPLGGESPQGSLVSTEHWWVRESGTAESFDNTQQQELLRRIADATGGSYLAFNESDQLRDVLTQSNAALKREVSLPLWNMPFLFLCLLTAKALEWLLRLRWKRL
ncbi:MAG: VWA domain-containing protein [Granulosicoccus sp.]